jgi:hypothetical protein
MAKRNIASHTNGKLELVYPGYVGFYLQNCLEQPQSAGFDRSLP